MTKERDWEGFYQATKESPPSPLLVKALDQAGNKRKALDLGAGALKDSKFLLAQGFDVTAVDMEEALTGMAEAVASEKLHPIVAAFDAYGFPEEEYDVVNAMYALPFNPPETFDVMFAKLKASLSPGGVFCGQFFGPKDQWSEDPKMTFHTKEQVEKLLDDLEILSLVEREWDGRTTDGNPKHWHVFDVIARKVLP